ncbi:LLM class flavin-dependent oxidoreductase [Solirubrobacter ginsenosidimutans]|uniref:LLM class flavin-dependent oxidoreductase n=1 Tax=Solirubrobacter ginsenosidimutans TaxID=490573 RepID=A0A9X3S0G4_9ACTN|nr:LLM class flavin-dependent oxidoreductase [Solirubrobacter ginsenosidimutans]MDA0162030.1 LLM class flavin-dependent oxidoreductase [Solirubrobacter ginsenosidimutans]
MDVGIGLPSTIRGATGAQIVDWARRAEARDFSSLGTIDRIVYANYEPLIALAAAAAVTERIKLATTILIAPLRVSGAMLAKQAASVDALSGGRLVLGVAVGGREDDYEAAGAEFGGRGKAFDHMLEQWDEIWSGDSIGPAGRPTVILGGSSGAAFRRAAAHDGWIMGGGSPDQFREGLAKLQTAWQAAGRDGKPQTMALSYFALGDNAKAAADGYLNDYYGFLGEMSQMVADGAAKDADTVRAYVQGFADAGCDELVFFPCDPDPGQVDLLADALG